MCEDSTQYKHKKTQKNLEILVEIFLLHVHFENNMVLLHRFSVILK